MSKSKPQPHVALAETILREAREELSRADEKSSLLLAAAGVVLGAIVAAVVAGDWSPFDLRPSVQWLWWAGSTAGIASLVAFAYSVYPRTTYRGQRPPSIVAYYGDVVSTPEDQLEERLVETATAAGSRSLDQLKIISEIVDKKFRGIQIGLWLIAASTFACVVAVVLDPLL